MIVNIKQKRKLNAKGKTTEIASGLRRSTFIPNQPRQRLKMKNDTTLTLLLEVHWAIFIIVDYKTTAPRPDVSQYSLLYDRLY